MQDQVTIKIREEFPDTHYFIYKTQRYPIKWKYFKFSSKYFSRKKNELKHTESINLIDDEDFEESHFQFLQLSKENIQSFIKYVQHQPISINKENVTALYYLSTKYEVDDLISDTRNYIINHQSEFALDLLLLHQNNSNFPSEIYEKIISNNLVNFINDKRFLLLPIPLIFRILSESKITSSASMSMA